MFFFYICQNNYHMKHLLSLVILLLFSVAINAQSKEKIKGSKIVTIEKKNTQSFENIEIIDDLEIFLIKGDSSDVELEADDNLQQAVNIEHKGNTIILSTAQKVTGFKKFTIRVYYTDNFKSVTAKDKSKVHILERMELPEVNFNLFDQSKLFLNIDSKIFNINADDKSEVQLNAKSELASIIISKNATLKALIDSKEIKVDLYQKAKANIEGDSEILKLRLDNNSTFTGKNLTAKNVELIAEGYAFGSIFAEKIANLNMSGNCEIELFGEPVITLSKFSDSVTLFKKSIVTTK